MKYKVIPLIAISIIITFSSLTTVAQKTANYQNPVHIYQAGLELFQKEKFGSAEEKFNEIIQLNNVPYEMKANANYYKAVCALMLINNDAPELSCNFVKNYPENPKTNTLNFLLADYYFKTKKYKDAKETYEQIKTDQLSEEQKFEYFFKYGYCSFMEQDMALAKANFKEIINKDSKYMAPANYYFAHIAYQEKNYETALKSFKKLLNDENYGKIAPYYMLQVYYYQQKYDEIILLAPSVLESGAVKRNAEISRLCAEAYYQTERYSEAIPYLESFLKNNTQPLSREDNYMIAFNYYKVNDYQKAIQYFNKVNSIKEDSLTQITDYQLAECYYKSGQKESAMNMFASAYKLNFDKGIQQNAMFNYAKLMYETSYNPYNNAINVLNEYIQKYPNASNLDEAYEYVSNMYFSSKNYKDALLTLENIKKRNTKLNTAYQRIAYLRGLELFNNNDFDGAITSFDKALSVSGNQTIEANSHFWTAEAYYRQGLYDKAINNYQLMQASNGASGSEFLPESNYGLGYCYFKNKNYASSLNYFKKYADNENVTNIKQKNDALNRIGDCYFIQKDFETSIEYYDKGIQMKALDVDYALYQKSLAQGAQAKFESKAATLIKLIDSYKNSTYRAASIFELATTYQNLNNTEKAVNYFDLLNKEYPKSSYVSQSMLKKGLIYYNESKDQLALTTLKKVVTDFPGTSDSKEALVTIRNIYVDMDQVDDFFKYVKDIPFANVSDSEQDSITYIAIENRYMKDDCAGSMPGFTEYLKKFPQGAYVLDAHFYLAECQYRSGLADSAASNYAYVADKPKSKFTETSLVKLSEIYYNKKNYEKALGVFTDLEKNAEYKENILTSVTGQMRCNYQLGFYQNAIQTARKLLTKEKISSDLIEESHLTMAKSAMALDSSSLAMAELIYIGKICTNEKAAEAKYLLAEMYFKNGNYTEAEKTAFDLINQMPAYDYWLAKSFILLADNYVKTGNIHQAKYTLKSIIENYEGADLIKIAQDKLNKINEDEKAEEQRKADELLKQQNATPPPPDVNLINE